MPIAPPPSNAQQLDSRTWRDWFYSIYAELGRPGSTLGTMAYENANSVSITGGAIGGVGISGSTVDSTPIGQATASAGKFTTLQSTGPTTVQSLNGYVKGTTGLLSAASTIPNTDITGLGTMSTQNANNVAITGGSIDGTTVGATTQSSGKFTTLSSNGNTSFSGNNVSISIQPTGTGVVYVNPATTGYMDNMAIGVTTPNRVNTNALKTTGLTGYLYGHDNTGDVTASTTVPYTDLGRFPYGQFYSTSSQTAAAINTVYTVNIDTQDGHYLTSLASNQVTVTNAGVYNIQFSFQFTNSSTSIGNVAFWPVVNGTDVPWSATSIAVTASHGGTPGYTSAAANVMVALNAGDIVKMRWVTDNTSVSIFANTTPPPFTAPLIPGIILTLQFVSSS